MTPKRMPRPPLRKPRPSPPPKTANSRFTAISSTKPIAAAITKP